MSKRTSWEDFTQHLRSLQLEPVDPPPDDFHLKVNVRLKCRCGNIFVGNTFGIWHHGSASCGCLHLEKLKLKRSEKRLIDIMPALEKAQLSIVSPMVQMNDRLAGVKTIGAYRFLCRCGKLFGEKVVLQSVISGNTTSCGCIKIARAKTLNPGTLTAGMVRQRMNEVGLLKPAFELPPDYTFKSHEQIGFICVCGNLHHSIVFDVHAGRVRSCGCVKSHAERELYDFVVGLIPEAKRNTRKVLDGREVDIWVPSQKLAIELNGLFWHSERVFPEERARRDILDKLLQLRGIGARGLFFFEDEWRSRRAAVEGFIRSALGLKKTIGARRCELGGTRQQLLDFIVTHHIQGAAGGEVFGLLLDDKVVAAMQIEPARPSITEQPNTWELTRYCCGELGVAGGLSKLLAAFRREHSGATIVSFSDERLSDGKLYAAAGFQRGATSEPRYWYMKGGDGVRRHRFGFRKDALRERGWLREGETERECMIRMGYTRVWDAGKTKWILKA